MAKECRYGNGPKVPPTPPPGQPGKTIRKAHAHNHPNPRHDRRLPPAVAATLISGAAGCATPPGRGPHSMTDLIVTRDMARVLDCLRDGPSTCREIAGTLRLTRTRTNALLVELARKQAIHAPRCAISAKGGNVNLWELKTRKGVAT